MSMNYTPEQHAARRSRAVSLKEKGWLQRDIAEAMGVSNGAVSQWLKDYRAHGEAVFTPRYRATTPTRFAEQFYPQLRTLLQQGPQAHGYADGLWTGQRVAKLIGEHFAVTLSTRTAYRVLDRLGYSLQKPEHRASERDPQAIDQWHQQHLRAIKKNAGITA
jgi:transposase